ncbi:YggT family protein [Tumebacillus permanentifrigoris]|uniref:YggT family protein n=1 Tax=Tumebacillus permanentifrigoris TaxID=378543 RepID=A0A316DPF9_9BACL|nr:YggT family protein [Tumebacillus permanentifrigoris]PWK04953.1 YggT family protein [Tumebacillus permanentifrigoris]
MVSLTVIIVYAMRLYSYLLFASVLVTWFPDIQKSTIGRLLYRITEPYFGIFRRFIPSVRLGGGYMDFSPVVALIVYDLFVQRGVIYLLGKVLY